MQRQGSVVDAMAHRHVRSDTSLDTSHEAVGGGVAVPGALPPTTGSQLELSQDYD